MKMKVFACKHDGHYLTGYSVVVAETEEQFKEMIKQGLRKHGLNPDKQIEYTEIDINEPSATLLWNGDY